MNRPRIISAAICVFGMTLFAFLGVMFSPPPQGDAEQLAQAEKDKPKIKRERPEAKPIAMPASPVGLEITLGLKDKEATPWKGEIQLSEGKVLSVDVVHGGANPKVEDNKFTVRSTRRMQMQRVIIDPALLHINLDAPLTAKVTIKTEQGEIATKLSDLAAGATKEFLDGQVSLERQEAAIRLTGRTTEDDFPAMARGSDGTSWLAYVEYQAGPPIVSERVLAGGFDDLVPAGHGDLIRLVRFDGRAFQPAMDVTEEGIDVWRPAVAVDGKGNVVVAWSQQVNNDWEIFYRRYTPPTAAKPGQWSDTVRVTNAPGSDFHVVAATDSAGNVWLAWQAWRKNDFDIMVAALAGNDAWREPRAIGGKGNDWTPAIAADSKGTIYVAWDTYEDGNYDVKLLPINPPNLPPAKAITVAGSPRFEARPSLVCDAKDRVWIAYEEGDEQWGKDYANEQFKRIGLEKNPGFALYINRTVKVKTLVAGKLMQPAANLQEAMSKKLGRNKSLPRLAADAAGGIWLLLRHSPHPTGVGEVWASYALRYDGKQWSAPSKLAGSNNLLDNRPALAPLGQGILTVYSGDNRLRTQNRDQDDLFAAVLTPAGQTYPPELGADEPAAEPKLPLVHPDEAKDVAKMREYIIDHEGKKLHLLRGEFHRHTEFSAHRDIDGLLEDSWRYALDAGSLDWMGNGDHDNGFHQEYMWWIIQKVTDLHHNAPHFVAALTYERSNAYPNGHRNVIMPRRGIRPLPRGQLMGDPEKGTPDTKVVYAYLKHFGGICASHTSGTNMGTDWRDNSPEFEPIVEIYQGHRHNYEHAQAPRSPTAETQIGGYQPAGYVWNAFEKGYRFGFQSSSDHISTHMSYAVVLTDDNSRQGLIDAFKKRHCYAATDNIILDVRSGEHLQGDAFDTNKPPALDIFARGTGLIAKVHVIRDNKYVSTMEPKAQEAKLKYVDMDAKPGESHYYYVRVEQADTSIAWGSPVWITYKKP